MTNTHDPVDELTQYLLKTLRRAWDSWEEQKNDPNEGQPDQDQWAWTAQWLAECLLNDGPFHAYTSNEIAHMFRATDAMRAILYQGTGGSEPRLSELIDYGFKENQVN